jgi:DNA-binding MltR family transcriptional regulator
MADESAWSKSSAVPGGAYDIMAEVAQLFPLATSSLPFLEAGLNDTTVVLLSTGLIERFLRLSLISVFRSDTVSKNMIAKVFEGKGPLSTFSAKIDVCTGLGNLLPDARHDLLVINKIRNEFAHSPRQLFLKDFSGCLSLKLKSRLEIRDDCKQREMFKHSCAGIIGSLTSGTLISIATNRFVAANADGVIKEYELMIRSAETDAEPSE